MCIRDSVTLFEYSQIYSSLISFLLSLIYIDYISSNSYKLPIYGHVTERSKIFAKAGFYLMLAYIAAILILSHFATIYCSDGDGEKFTNYQVNDNIQRNRSASPTFTSSPEPMDEAPFPNVQKNINIQQNVEG